MTNNLVHVDTQTDNNLLNRNIPGLKFWTSETHLPSVKRSGRSADVFYSITQNKDDYYLEDNISYRLIYIHAFPRSIPDENATNQKEINEEVDGMLRNSITRAFDAANNETFYDGFDSYFSETISRFILAFGVQAIVIIEEILESNPSASETVEETLRQLGKIVDPHTHAARLALLLRAIGDRNPRIRDAASIGIASLDDPVAIPFLHHAIKTEPSAWVRTNLTLTLQQISKDM